MKLLIVVGLVLCALSDSPKDVGNGFLDFGVAVNRANARGIVATSCGKTGYECALIWLMDFAGGFAIIAVDASTGQTVQINTPVSLGGDSPYSSLLSKDGRFYYAHAGSYFFQFDAVLLNFTFWEKTKSLTAMAMTLDDNGNVYSATYPNSGLVKFDPTTKTITDFGYLHNESWAQYQRYLACDDFGDVYFAIGNTASQIIWFRPSTNQIKTLLNDNERFTGTPSLYRDNNGKVYATNVGGSLYMLYKGVRTDITSHVANRTKIISGDQGLFYKLLPSGKSLVSVDTVNKIMVVRVNSTSTVSLPLTYTSNGAETMDMLASPDGKSLFGGTAFPMMFFSMNPTTGEFINQRAYGQFNTMENQGAHAFFGVYSQGVLLDYDPSKPWIDTLHNNNNTNPVILCTVSPTIIRPSNVMSHTDGKTLVLSGTPCYGCTGGGLLFYDRTTKQSTLLTHEQVIKYHSTNCIVPLKDKPDILLGATTISPGTGGATIATVAELYLINMTSKIVTWHSAIISGVTAYSDLRVLPSGLIVGIANRNILFVFNATIKSIVYQQNIAEVSGAQGPRCIIPHPTDPNIIYISHSWKISQFDVTNFTLYTLVNSNIGIYGGTVLKNGYFYFRRTSHVYGVKLFNATNEDEPTSNKNSDETTSQISSIRYTIKIIALSLVLTLHSI